MLCTFYLHSHSFFFLGQGAGCSAATKVTVLQQGMAIHARLPGAWGWPMAEWLSGWGAGEGEAVCDFLM